MTIDELLTKDFTKLNANNLAAYKRRWAKVLGFTPKNSQILASYRHLVATKKLPSSPQFISLLRIRKVRSLSGVTPFSVMTKPFACPGRCTYCPLDDRLPKSYLADEPGAQRALAANFDPRVQIKNRLDQLQKTGHLTNKIELIVIGGTFSAYPKTYRLQFFLDMFRAINGQPALKPSSSPHLATLLPKLQTTQRLNETSSRRVVGISIETRPDWLTPDEIIFLRQLGVTKLQIGAQAFDETILKRINRGHSLQALATATRLARNAGLKICYHFMPNLPDTTPDHDIAMARTMFTDPAYQPDYLKVYPCQVIPGTILHEEWQTGEYRPYSQTRLKHVLKEIKLMTPTYCRIDRLVRDISKGWVVSGTRQTNLRQIIQAELKVEDKACRCIRCREIKHHHPQDNPAFHQLKYQTLGGTEYFLSFETKQHLYSLLRLRLPDRGEVALFPELKNSAIIREVHTFGLVSPLGQTSPQKTQHRGLGKKLISKAETIAQQAGFKKIAVIAAIGTKPYYRKLGFTNDGLYLTKQLN